MQRDALPMTAPRVFSVNMIRRKSLSIAASGKTGAETAGASHIMTAKNAMRASLLLHFITERAGFLKTELRFIPAALRTEPERASELNTVKTGYAIRAYGKTAFITAAECFSGTVSRNLPVSLKTA